MEEQSYSTLGQSAGYVQNAVSPPRTFNSLGGMEARLGLLINEATEMLERVEPSPPREVRSSGPDKGPPTHFYAHSLSRMSDQIGRLHEILEALSRHI